MTSSIARPAPPRFGHFSPRDYLSTYYREVQEDEQQLMAWLVGEARPYLRALAGRGCGGQTLLDVGCGPTIHHLLPLADLVDRAIVTDLVSANLAEVSDWLCGDAAAHDWTPFADECARLLRDHRTGAPRLLEARIRAVMEVGPALDLTEAEPWSEWVDVVTTFFCPCSATTDIGQFTTMLGRTTERLRPGGAFVGSFLGGCHAYRVGPAWFPSPGLSIADVATALDRSGVDVASLEQVSTTTMQPDGFDHIFVAAGRKRR